MADDLDTSDRIEHINGEEYKIVDDCDEENNEAHTESDNAAENCPVEAASIENEAAEEHPVPCDDGNTSFTRPKDPATNEGEKPYPCPECNKSFKKARYLHDHRLSHSGKRPFACNECPKTFTRSYQLTLHRREHAGEKPYKCSKCGNCYRKSWYLRDHQKACRKRIAAAAAAAAAAAEGGAEVKAKTEEKEEATHADTPLDINPNKTANKPYPCPECDKSFMRARYLRDHKLSHSGERPFSCAECSKTFTRSSHLALHRREHAGEKPYKCSKCGNCYRKSGYLRDHQKACRKRKTATAAEAAAEDKDEAKTLEDKDKEEATRVQTPKVLKETDEGASKPVSREHTVERPCGCVSCSNSYLKSRNLRDCTCQKQTAPEVEAATEI